MRATASRHFNGWGDGPWRRSMAAAVLATGGMAHSERVLRRLRTYVEWIAPVAVYPGEDELQALAEGVFRVLDGEEQAKRMPAEA